MTDTEDWGKPAKHPVQDLGGSIIWREMVAEHGWKRSVTLVGWAVVLASVSADDEPLEVARDRLLARGVEKTTLWRVIRDIRKVADRLDMVYEKKFLAGIAKLQLL